MIIGENEQRTTYYEMEIHEPPQYEVILKRKFSNGENSVENISNNFNGHYENINVNKQTKLHHYADGTIISENYQSFSENEIHEINGQSYINLTVMTAPPGNFQQHQNVSPSNSSQHLPQTSDFCSNIHLREDNKLPAINNNNKYEIRNYQHQQSDTVENDNEDKNLSWLFNFKLDDIANLSPEIKRKRTNNTDTINQQNFYNQPQQQQQQQQFDDLNQRSAKDPCIDDDLNVAENIVISSNTPIYTNTVSSHTPKKPPFTYTELIEYALEDKGELTVSGIYQWISDRFSYYKSNDDRWKNSVRHNLSINPHFRKGNKAKAGAGHLWKISSRESEANFLAWEHKKQRLELFFKMEAANSIKNRKGSVENTIKVSEVVSTSSPSYQDELNAATASISGSVLLPIDESSSNIITTHGDPDSPSGSQMYSTYQEILPISHHHQQSNDELRRSAGEILNGSVRRNVEVQIMHPGDLHGYSILETEDYLNPISKEEIMQESGLGFRRHDEQFYLIDSGINMSSTNGTDETTEVFEIFHDDFNLNYFGNNIIA